MHVIYENIHKRVFCSGPRACSRRQIGGTRPPLPTKLEHPAASRPTNSRTGRHGCPSPTAAPPPACERRDPSALRWRVCASCVQTAIAALARAWKFLDCFSLYFQSKLLYLLLIARNSGSASFTPEKAENQAHPKAHPAHSKVNSMKLRLLSREHGRIYRDHRIAVRMRARPRRAITRPARVPMRVPHQNIYSIGIQSNSFLDQSKFACMD